MTLGNYYLLGIIIVYLLAFFIRNLKTYFSLKTSIRGKSAKLTFSLVLSTIIYLITLAHLFFPNAHNLAGKISFLQIPILQYSGYGLVLAALLIGLAALYVMKNSWRVGIKYDQKTDLVTTGIYSLSRNPYFLSYDLLFIGIFFIYPSIILFVLLLCILITFHLMILEEEKYLEHVQKVSYRIYRKKVGRYL